MITLDATSKLWLGKAIFPKASSPTGYVDTKGRPAYGVNAQGRVYDQIDAQGKPVYMKHAKKKSLLKKITGYVSKAATGNVVGANKSAGLGVLNTLGAAGAGALIGSAVGGSSGLSALSGGGSDMGSDLGSINIPGIGPYSGGSFNLGDLLHLGGDSDSGQVPGASAPGAPPTFLSSLGPTLPFVAVGAGLLLVVVLFLKKK